MTTTKNKSLTKANTALTLKDVPKLLANLEKQKSALIGNTSENISLDVNYELEKISEIKSVSRLLEISASIHARAAAYNLEKERYNLLEENIADFMHNGLNVEEWRKILEKAINIILNADKIKKLDTAIIELSNYMSEEEKLSRSLSNILNLANAPIQ